MTIAQRGPLIHIKRRLDLPIIFLTGHPDIPTTVKTIKAGADDFLTKRVSSDKLLDAVRRAIADHGVRISLKPSWTWFALMSGH